MGIHLRDPDQELTAQTFTFALRKDKPRIVPCREGNHMLRSNLGGKDRSALRQYSIQLTEIEQDFEELRIPNRS